VREKYPPVIQLNDILFVTGSEEKNPTSPRYEIFVMGILG